MAKDEPAIELADVDLSLGEGVARVHILHGVSMTIGRGEAVGLVGASGSDGTPGTRCRSWRRARR